MLLKPYHVTEEKNGHYFCHKSFALELPNLYTSIYKMYLSLEVFINTWHSCRRKELSKAKFAVAISPMQGKLITLYVSIAVQNKLNFVPHTECQHFYQEKPSRQEENPEFTRKKTSSVNRLVSCSWD